MKLVLHPEVEDRRLNRILDACSQMRDRELHQRARRSAGDRRR